MNDTLDLNKYVRKYIYLYLNYIIVGVIKPYIPFGLNFWTVFLFLVTAQEGYRQNCDLISMGCLLCFLTGILYHGSYPNTF